MAKDLEQSYIYNIKNIDAFLQKPEVGGSISKFFRKYPQSTIKFWEYGLCLDKKIYEQYKISYSNVRSEDALVKWMYIHKRVTSPPTKEEKLTRVTSPPTKKEKLTLLEWYKKTNPTYSEISRYLERTSSSKEEGKELLVYLNNKKNCMYVLEGIRKVLNCK